MSKHVIEISPHQTLAQAAETISNHHISGAPVTDEQGHCVGMLTATDFLLQERGHTHPAGDQPLQGDDRPAKPESAAEAVPIDIVTHELVRDHMTPDVQSVSPDAMLMDAARTMCAAHVHRLPVLDDKGHVQGLISSMDIVAAMIQAIEE